MKSYQRLLRTFGLRREHPSPSEPRQPPSTPLPEKLDDAISLLRGDFGQSSDFIIRQWPGEGGRDVRLAVAYIDGLVDQKLLSRLLEAAARAFPEDLSDPSEAENRLKDNLPAGNIGRVRSKEEVEAAVLEGGAVVLVNGCSEAVTAAISGGERRAVEEPTSQTVVRGPKEGFTEDLPTNVSLIRRKLRTPHLRIEKRKLGRYTQTAVAIAYVEGLAEPSIVAEVRKRLDGIDTDSILESGYVEEFIQDKTWSPFPLIQNTERPDAVAGSLLEGQVAILVDGTPFVLLAPVTFFKFFQSSEDFYQHYDLASLLRIIRLFSFFVGMLLPSLYIAVTTFHQEMLPTTLLISLAAQREGTPLPAFIEALLMEITFEVIREAGVRMPRAIGPAISIVGALVLGQAAVQAGIVSGAMVIVVSFTAIANFVIPALNMASAVRLTRFGLMMLAGTFGLFGILIGAVPILTHVLTLRSFGVPYFTPLAPVRLNNLKDLFIRLPWPVLKTRPQPFGGQNRWRQGGGARRKGAGNRSGGKRNPQS